MMIFHRIKCGHILAIKANKTTAVHSMSMIELDFQNFKNFKGSGQEKIAQHLYSVLVSFVFC